MAKIGLRANGSAELDVVQEGRRAGRQLDRAPSVEVSGDTVEILVEHGFRYDASFSASDFTPYYLRSGDSWSGEAAYGFGETVDLVGIPFYRGVSDFTYFEFVGGATYQQLPASSVFEIWAEEFRYAHEHAPEGIYDLALHPQVIGRGHRMRMLERLIDEIAASEGVSFMRLDDYVERWRNANPLEDWCVATRSSPARRMHPGSASRAAAEGVNHQLAAVLPKAERVRDIWR